MLRTFPQAFVAIASVLKAIDYTNAVAISPYINPLNCHQILLWQIS